MQNQRHNYYSNGLHPHYLAKILRELNQICTGFKLIQIRATVAENRESRSWIHECAFQISARRPTIL